MAFPQITVRPSAAKRIRNYDCWVFRDEIAAAPPSFVSNGDVVEVLEATGTFLAYAWYSPASHIAARVVSTVREHAPDREWLKQRLAAAIGRRAAISGTNAKRLVFSEADGLPGLIVDQYGDYLVVQSRTAGIDRSKSAIVELLSQRLKPRGILERSDKEFREEEGLPPAAGVLHGSVPQRISIEEDALTFLVDPYQGHKTGFYLDQRETRRAVRAQVQPDQRVLDVFAYTGAFGIAAASRGATVICAEQSEAHVALAKENAALNHVSDRMEFVVGDAWYWLEAAAKQRARYDWVLLDPPSLAKSQRDALKARQALHRLLVFALDLLAEGGTLVLSLCTYHLLERAEEILRIAASQQRRRLRIRAVTMQAADHPWVLQMPMTRYLMTWFAQDDGSPAA